MKTILAIVVGFVHDFAAGCWAATVLAVWWLARSAAGEPAVGAVIAGLQRQFFWIGLVCIAIVLATGAGRSFSYVENLHGKEAESRRRRMLIIKHVLLFGIFSVGTWWQYRIAFA